MNNDEFIWLGQTDSFTTYGKLLARMMASSDGPWSEKNKTESRLLEVVGNVGVISVNGSLINGSAGWMVNYGVMGYDDIREALVEALNHSEVGSILLNVNSGGGAAEGPNELSQVIQRIDKVKPVITYTGSHMHSAALWLGTAARRVYAGETAQVGSLGTLIIHRDMSGAYAAENIKVTIIRAGKSKALVNPYEPLSKEARTDLQNKAQYMYDLFLGAVAKHRGLNEEVADEQFGQGREFFGAQAVANGLIDEVGSYEDAYTYAQKLAAKRMDPNRRPSPTAVRFGSAATANAPKSAEMVTQALQMSALSEHNSPTCQGSNMPKPLSEIEIAAIAAGVVMPTVSASATTDAQAAPAVATAPAVQADNQSGAAPAAPTAPAVTAAAPQNDGLANLVTMLATSQAEVGRLTAEMKTLQSTVEANTRHSEDLIGIARAAVTSMGLHFGMTAESVAAMDANTVVSEYKRVSGLFKEKFKAGGVAATSASVDDGKSDDKAAMPLFFQVATKSAK